MKKRSSSELKCPKCGSSKVQFIARRHEYRMSLVLLGILLLCLPVLLWLFYGSTCHVHNEVAYAVGFMTGFIGIIVLFIARHAHSNYKCKHCGHEFCKR